MELDYEEKEECWKCNGEKVTHHECGEDTCVCIDKSPNVLCDVCIDE